LLAIVDCVAAFLQPDKLIKTRINKQNNAMGLPKQNLVLITFTILLQIVLSALNT